MELLSVLLLVTALSTDAFVASFAYGSNRIRIPPASVAVISGVCSVVLAVSLLAGALVRPLLPPQVATGLCFIVLFALGVVKLFDSAIKACIRKHQGKGKQFSFSLFHLRFILKIYADPEAADQDCSRVLSPAEAAFLALSLSLDGLAVGFGAALARLSLPLAVVCSLAVGMLAVMLGGWLGERLARKLRFDLSWLSGALLILLACFKL